MGRGRYKVGRGSSMNKKIGGLLLSGEAAPDLMVELLPALLWLERSRRHSQNLCVSACITLHHAYAVLGIAAHPRAVDLVVSNQRTGARTLYGRPDPYWTDTTFHGHCVLWLPGSTRFIDPTVEQYPEVRRYQLGPICGPIAAVVSTAQQRAALARGELPAGTAIGVHRQDLLLLYTTVDTTFDDVVTSAPIVAEFAEETERSGRNLASEALLLLSRAEVIDRARRTPHPRLRALLDVLADAQGEVDDDGNWRFVLPDGTTPRLDEITVPVTVPDPRPSGITATQSASGVLDADHAAAEPARRRGLLDALRGLRVGPNRR